MSTLSYVNATKTNQEIIVTAKACGVNRPIALELQIEKLNEIFTYKTQEFEGYMCFKIKIPQDTVCLNATVIDTNRHSDATCSIAARLFDGKGEIFLEAKSYDEGKSYTAIYFSPSSVKQNFAIFYNPAWPQGVIKQIETPFRSSLRQEIYKDSID